VTVVRGGVDTHYNVYIMIYVHAQHCT